MLKVRVGRKVTGGVVTGWQTRGPGSPAPSARSPGQVRKSLH